MKIYSSFSLQQGFKYLHLSDLLSILKMVYNLGKLNPYYFFVWFYLLFQFNDNPSPSQMCNRFQSWAYNSRRNK